MSDCKATAWEIIVIIWHFYLEVFVRHFLLFFLFLSPLFNFSSSLFPKQRNHIQLTVYRGTVSSPAFHKIWKFKFCVFAIKISCNSLPPANAAWSCFQSYQSVCLSYVCLYALIFKSLDLENSFWYACASSEYLGQICHNVTVLRNNIIFCDICCFRYASWRMSSLKGVANC